MLWTKFTSGPPEWFVQRSWLRTTHSCRLVFSVLDAAGNLKQEFCGSQHVKIQNYSCVWSFFADLVWVTSRHTLHQACSRFGMNKMCVSVFAHHAVRHPTVNPPPSPRKPESRSRKPNQGTPNQSESMQKLQQKPHAFALRSSK